MMWFNSMGAGGWLLMGSLMLLFWTAVIVGGMWLVRGRGGTSPGADGDLAARRILDERLARGEIDADHYRQGLDLLAHR